MPDPMGDRGQRNRQSRGSASHARRRLGRLGTVIGAITLAMVTAFATGIGTKLADLVTASESRLLSYSASSVGQGCMGGTFLPQNPMNEVLRGRPPADWSVIERQPDAAAVDRDSVEVSIQGESTRKVILTGIEFHVTRRARPPGAIFNEPCGGPIVGRAVEVNLDLTPPRVVDSNADERGLLGSRTATGKRLNPPIRFPWTVSLTDPLLLYVVAMTRSCYCVWSAEIPWVSGSERGTILIDNEGEGYRVTDSDGLAAYTAYEDRWRRYPDS